MLISLYTCVFYNQTRVIHTTTTMTKAKTTFFCKSCGFESPKWIGKCPGCSEWNTFIEEIKPTKQTTAWKKSGRKIAEPKPLNQIQANQSERLILPDEELNLVLGGGLVAGAVVLLGGEPGIGKSTLLLQIALQTTAKTLYVSGEESETQINFGRNDLALAIALVKYSPKHF